MATATANRSFSQPTSSFALSSFDILPPHGGTNAPCGDWVDARLSAEYIDRVLRGATKFVTVINLKTAKLLGLTLPPSVLLRADRVIQ
jgi:putative ABC transport system substrate-binding protein